MGLALYRKYRPKKFSEVSGQTHIKTTIQNEIELDRVSHAYIFSGPRGTGKTTLARLLAKAVNCLKRKKGESEPCGECDSCAEIVQARSIDVIEIDAASHTGVDNVRENIIQGAKFLPSLRKYKIYIIDEIHMLSLSAFNALLKTLEEPPAHAIFVLATTELHKVPETIQSRCQRFDFRNVSISDIIKRIEYVAKREERELEPEVINLIALRSEGCVRDAESILEQVLALGDKKITLEQARLVIPYNEFSLVLEFLKKIQEKRLEELIAFINRIVDEGVDVIRFIDDTIEGLRKILLAKISGALRSYDSDVRKDEETELSRLARGFEISEIVKIIEILLEQKTKVSDCPIQHLPLELAVVELCMKEKVQASGASIPLVAVKAERPREFSASAPKKAESDSPEKNAIPLEKIFQHWDEILEKVRVYNHTLFSFVRMNKPRAVQGNSIELGVEYPFHKERIDDMKNRLALEKIFEEILGVRVKIQTVLLERKSSPENAKESKDVEALAQEFGGSVVE